MDRTVNNLTVRQMALIHLLRKVPKVNSIKKLDADEQQFLKALPRAPVSAGRSILMKELFDKAATSAASNGDAKLKTGDIFRETHRQWAALLPAQKNAYEQRANQAWSQYKSNIQSFLSSKTPVK